LLNILSKRKKVIIKSKFIRKKIKVKLKFEKKKNIKKNVIIDNGQAQSLSKIKPFSVKTILSTSIKFFLQLITAKTAISFILTCY